MSLTDKGERGREKGKNIPKRSACCTNVGHSYSTKRTREGKGAVAAQDEAEEADPQQPRVLGSSPLRLDRGESHLK